jgi:hypothetical protein
MQDKIASAVGRGIGAPPNFVFGKLLQAFHDVGKIVLRDQLLRFRKKQACGTACLEFHWAPRILFWIDFPTSRGRQIAVIIGRKASKQNTKPNEANATGNYFLAK